MVLMFATIMENFVESNGKAHFSGIGPSIFSIMAGQVFQVVVGLEEGEPEIQLEHDATDIPFE